LRPLHSALRCPPRLAPWLARPTVPPRQRARLSSAAWAHSPPRRLSCQSRTKGRSAAPLRLHAPEREESRRVAVEASRIGDVTRAARRIAHMLLCEAANIQRAGGFQLLFQDRVAIGNGLGIAGHQVEAEAACLARVGAVWVQLQCRVAIRERPIL